MSTLARLWSRAHGPSGPGGRLDDRLGEWKRDRKRLHELAVAAAIVLATAYLSLSIDRMYPMLFGGLLAAGVTVLMIENQEKTLYLVLFFSTVYLTVRATLLGWSNAAFLLKDGFLFLLFGFWFIQFMLREQRLPDTPLNKPLLALCAWLLLECFNPNTYGFLTIVDDLRFWLGPLAIFVMTIHLVDSREKLERGLRVVFLYAVLETLYGIAQQWMPGDLLVKLGADPTNYFYFYQGTIRSFSTMGTVGFALFAGMFTPLCFFFMSQQRDQVKRFLLFALGFAFILAVILTLVRVAWVALIGSLMAYSFVTRRFKIVVVLFLIGAVVIVSASGFMRWKVEGLLNPDEDASFQRRLEILESVSLGATFRVFGYGLGTFAHNKFSGGQEDKIGYGAATESWYLMTSLQLGWIGVGILLWMWYKIYRFAWLGYHGGLATRRYRELAIALGASLLVIEIARLGGPAGYYPPDSWHYWFLAGLLMRLPTADAELAREEASAPANAPVPAAA